MHEALDKIAQFGSGGAVLGVAFMRVHQPRIAHNMAGGGKIADIGMQHPSNPNMMQMGQSGGNGNTPTNVPSSTQNTPLTPNTPGQLGTAQPGTTLTQPVTNPTQPPHNPLNQVNPSTQANAPGSPQHTPLQNNTGTVQSPNQQPYYTSSTGNTQKFNLARQDIPFSNQQLTNASKLPKVNRLTAAGHAYQKHSHGPGANPNLPRIGSHNKMNEEGEKFVQFILDHPQASFTKNHVANVGIFFDIEVPGIGGIRFTLNGELRGFLNP